MSRARNRILIGIGALLVACVLVAWLAVDWSWPKEPAYQERPLSEWLDGRAEAKGASLGDLSGFYRSIGPEALPWLVSTLKANQCGKVERNILAMRIRLYKRRTFLNRFLPDPSTSRKETLRFNILSLLCRFAPGTPYEKGAARAVIRARGIGVLALNFEELRLVTLARFTNCQSMVLPELLSGVTNPVPGHAYGKYQDLCKLGPVVGPALYRIAMTEPGTDGPAARALAQLDTNAWARLVVEKRGR